MSQRGWPPGDLFQEDPNPPARGQPGPRGDAVTPCPPAGRQRPSASTPGPTAERGPLGLQARCSAGLPGHSGGWTQRSGWAEGPGGLAAPLPQGCGQPQPRAPTSQDQPGASASCAASLGDAPALWANREASAVPVCSREPGRAVWGEVKVKALSPSAPLNPKTPHTPFASVVSTRGGSREAPKPPPSAGPQHVGRSCPSTGDPTVLKAPRHHSANGRHTTRLPHVEPSARLAWAACDTWGHAVPSQDRCTALRPLLSVQMRSRRGLRRGLGRPGGRAPVAWAPSLSGAAPAPLPWGRGSRCRAQANTLPRRPVPEPRSPAAPRPTRKARRPAAAGTVPTLGQAGQGQQRPDMAGRGRPASSKGLGSRAQRPLHVHGNQGAVSGRPPLRSPPSERLPPSLTQGAQRRQQASRAARPAVTCLGQRSTRTPAGSSPGAAALPTPTSGLSAVQAGGQPGAGFLPESADCTSERRPPRSSPRPPRTRVPWELSGARGRLRPPGSAQAFPQSRGWPSVEPWAPGLTRDRPPPGLLADARMGDWAKPGPPLPGRHPQSTRWRV